MDPRRCAEARRSFQARVSPLTGEAPNRIDSLSKTATACIAPTADTAQPSFWPRPKELLKSRLTRAKLCCRTWILVLRALAPNYKKGGQCNLTLAGSRVEVPSGCLSHRRQLTIFLVSKRKCGMQEREMIRSAQFEHLLLKLLNAIFPSYLRLVLGTSSSILLSLKARAKY
jgi:hypothetical protein